MFNQTRDFIKITISTSTGTPNIMFKSRAMDLSSPKQQRIRKYPEFSGELEPRSLILNIAVNFCRYVSR